MPFLGAYFWRGLCTKGILRFKIDWASLIVERKFTVFALFDLVFEGSFQVQAPGGLYLERRFNGGFFALWVWGAYIWRGLFSEFYGSWSVVLISPETLGTFRSDGTESPTVTDSWSNRFRLAKQQLCTCPTFLCLSFAVTAHLRRENS